MEIPEFCTRAASVVTRKRKTEKETDPDYSPKIDRVAARKENSAEAKDKRESSSEFDSGVSSSFSASASPSGSGNGLLPLRIPLLQEKKEWMERRVVRRSKVLETERKKPAPIMQYINRQQYSIENWKDKAEESRKKREEFTRVTENKRKRLSLKRGDNGKKLEVNLVDENDSDDDTNDDTEDYSDDDTEDYSDDDTEDSDQNDAFDYKHFSLIAGDVEPVAQFLEREEVVNAENFDLKNLPYFVMGTGEGEVGGPIPFQFSSLWDYELDPLSPEDTEESIRANFPWMKDPTVPNFQMEILSVVAVFSVGRQLNLRLIAENCRNTEYNSGRCAPLIMRIRNPKSAALIFSSGRIILTGTKSVELCKQAARKYARVIQRLGYNVKVLSFTIQNISAECHLQFRVRLHHLANNKLFGSLSYYPEVFSGLILPLECPHVKLIIFYSGTVLLTGAKSMEDLDNALKSMYPLVKMYGY